MNRGWRKIATLNVLDMNAVNLARLLESFGHVYGTNAECKVTSDGLGVYLPPWVDR